MCGIAIDAGTMLRVFAVNVGASGRGIAMDAGIMMCWIAVDAGALGRGSPLMLAPQKSKSANKNDKNEESLLLALKQFKDWSIKIDIPYPTI